MVNFDGKRNRQERLIDKFAEESSWLLLVKILSSMIFVVWRDINILSSRKEYGVGFRLFNYPFRLISIFKRFNFLLIVILISL